MIHRKYENYRESNIGWFGDIPEHWDVKKFRYLFSLGRGLGITKSDLKEDGIPCVNYGEIHSKFGFEVVPEKHNLKCVSDDYLDKGVHSLLRSGDFIFADTSEDIEGSGNFTYLNSEIPTFAGYHTITAKLLTNDLPRFLAYVFDSLIYRFQIRHSVTGVKVFSITQSILKNSYVWLPPKEEQKKISKYLDYKVGQIDMLIKKKKELIKKLNEQRVAVITRTVTKGVDKSAKMKPSGIDWFGDIPEHWDVKKFRYLFSLGRGLGITKSDLKEDGIPCVNYGEIHSKFGFEVVPEKHNLKCVSDDYLDKGVHSLLRSGDFIFADTSEDIEGSGNFTYLNSEIPTFAGYHTITAKLLTNDLPRFLAYVFDSLIYRFQIRHSVTGVKVFSITQSILKNSYVWLPPKEEQVNIVKYLDFQLENIDKMISASNDIIDKLNEYRSALITAAVTGKIDVRDVVIGKGGE